MLLHMMHIRSIQGLCRLRVARGLVLGLTLSLATILSGVYAEALEDSRVYFDWKANDAAFEGTSTGRSYASIGNLAFALGGREADGTFSDRVQILEREEAGSYQRHTARLPEALAFAAVASHGSKLYVIGGLTAEGVTDRMWSLEWTNGELQAEPMPPLPSPRAFAAAAVHRTTIHHYLMVMGGLANVDDPAASDKMFSLPLPSQKSPLPLVWGEDDPLPSGGRLFPIAHETYNEVVVMGGYALDAEGNITPSDQLWGYSRIPRDGHVESGWVRRADFSVPVAQAAVSKTGQSHLTLVGGNRAAGKLQNLLEGTMPRDALSGVWAFHDPTDTWHLIGEVAQPVVGGTLLRVTGESYLWVDARTETGERVEAATLDFRRTTQKVSWIDWMVIAGYFSIVAFIGWRFAKKQNRSQDAGTFALGNRNVKWWASAVSMMATGVSTISFMAIPALVACIGLATSGPAIFLLGGVFLSAFLTYPLLRRLKITSTYEYIEQRFGPLLRMVGSFNSIVVQLMGRIGIVVMLPALAISTMTGIDPWISILVMGLLTTIYSSAGGFEAVIWTDVVQGLLMLMGFLAIGILAFVNIEGGGEAFIRYGVELDRFNLFITKWDVRIPMVWFAVVGFTLQFLAFAGDQTTAQRVLSIPLKDVRKMAFLSGAFGILIAYMAAFVGMALFAFYKSNPGYLSPAMQNDQLVPLFIVNKVPVGLSGLLLATLFAASMSTVSSSVNSIAVLVGEDFYKRFRKNVTPKEEMRVMQVVSVIAGAFGTGMALFLLSMDLPTLWESFMRIMAFVGGGFGGVFILGMFTRRAHELGAIIGVLAGFTTAYFVNMAHLSIHWSALSIFVTLSSVFFGYVSSLILPWKRKDLTGLTVWNQVKTRVTDEELIAK